MTLLHRSRAPSPACIALISIASVLLGFVVQASASTRNYLTVEGRVMDRAGAPIGNTWIFCTGSRRASVMTDAKGSYRLEIPGATLEELEKTPLKIRIQARQKGWRFALATGALELGLEMKVFKEESRLAQLLVKSNDSSAVQAVASSAVLDANPRALISAVFVGSKGTQPETSPAPLGIHDEVTLAGEDQSIPEVGDYAPPGTEVPPDPSLSSREAPKPRPDDVGSVLRVEPPGKKKSSATSSPSTPPSGGPTAMATPPSKTAGAAVAPLISSNAAPPGKQKRSKPPKPPKNSDKPRVYRPGLDPSENPAPIPGSNDPPPAAGAQSAPAPATQSAPSGQSAPPSTQGGPPPVYDASGGGYKSKPSRKTGEDLLKAVLLRDETVSDVGSRPPPPATQVTAPDRKAGDPGTPPGSASSGPTCNCTIRGTVEVQSEKPLSSSTEVVLAVEGADYSTNVELFMGSPRAFEIKSAPCGVHRLLLWTRSKQRFVLSMSEPRATCSPGGVQQLRLILEPVARWGSSAR